MKNFKFIFAALVLLGISSCNKYLDTNTDPNASTNSRVDLVLSSAQLNLAIGQGSRHTNQLLVWNQYWTGDQAVVTNDWDKNDMKPSDGNAPWISFYTLSLSSLKYLIESGNQLKYAGAAKILMAYEYQLLVDLYGDVPFTDALKGADATPNRAPAPDKQEDIYPKLLTMIDEGISLVGTPTSGAVKDISGDLMFNGDVDNWIRFGNSLKLRILMRQTNTGDATIATKVGSLVSTVGSSNFTFTTGLYAGISFEEDAWAKLNANPLFTELDGGALKNYYVASKTAIDYLLSTNDVRIDFQYTPGPDGHNGLPQGDQAEYTLLGPFSRPKGGKNDLAVDPSTLYKGDPYLYGPNVPFILMSNWEIDFLLAEAAARGWTGDDAQTLYNSAIQDNYDYFGAGDASGFYGSGSAAAGTGGGFDATNLNSEIKSIALQKWVSMNGIQATESWTETRRMDNTANPIFQSPGGIFIDPPLSVLAPGVFPSIVLYSEPEVNYNPGIHQHAITDKVFWDK